MSDETPALPPPRSRVGCSFAVVLIVLILAAFAAFLITRMEAWTGRAADRVRQAFIDVAHLQPRVTVRDRVVFEQTTSTLELVVATRQTQVERETEHERLGSTKRIRLRGTYDVRAGFDLTKPFSVHVEGTRVIAEVPIPAILSVDQKEIEVLAMENGLWNRISPADLETELRTLPNEARVKAGLAGLQKEALDLFKRQLGEKLGPGFQVEVRVTHVPVDRL